MSNRYHDSVEPPYRIQKRLVLNQCYKAVLEDLGSQPPSFTYITLGGRELYDVLDLVGVFDIQKSKIFIKSYEALPEIAREAANCPVAKTLGKMSSIDIEVIPNALQEQTITPLIKGGGERPFLYFLDYTDPFGPSHQVTLLALIRTRCLREGDYLIITSCLTPRVLNQKRRPFMQDYVAAFRLYFGLGGAVVTSKFRECNHVDLLVGQACSMLAGESASGPHIDAMLLRKYRYRDTRTPMGVWIYRITSSQRVASKLKNVDFKDYPWPITVVEQAALAPEEPQIFSDLED